MELNRKKIKARYYAIMDEIRGRNIGTFMIFLFISFLFWVLMVMNDDTQRDFVIPIRLENVPDDVTLLSSEPSSLNITIKDKGSSLLRYSLGNSPCLTFNFNEIATDKNRIVITRQKANNAIRSIFGQAQVMALNPDSLSIPFTRLAPRTVHAKVTTEDLSAAPQFIISGGLTITPDTIHLYSARPIKNLSTISTEPLIATNLKDTTEIELRLVTPEGMRAIPATVKVKIPVEPLILDTRSMPIEVINAPVGKHVITFPGEAKISYLIPMSLYNTGEKNNFKITADYSRRNNRTAKIPLTIPALPKLYHNPMLQTDSVEYLMEQH